jgi:UDPglucose 6-dehydrogenase
MDLYDELSADDQAAFLVEPDGLEVLSWRPEARTPEFLPVEHATQREFEGEILEVRTKMGRRVRVTPDHPFVVADAAGVLGVKLAGELTDEDWLPVAQLAPAGDDGAEPLDVLSALPAAGLMPENVIVRPRPGVLEAVGRPAIREAVRGLAHHPVPAGRARDIVRAGALRLPEADAVGITLDGASLGTARNGTYVPPKIAADRAFWRVVGLYIAEGHCSVDGSRHRLQWSFHPRDELSLVDEVASFWRGLGVKADIRWNRTSTAVVVSSRLLAAWWLRVLGLGAHCYEQRLPDLVWGAPEEAKRTLLSGLWQGDGSWSPVAGGPSVVLEYGTVSPELADGVLRLLGDLGIVASARIGRSARATTDAHFVRVSGADQVEALVDLVSPPDGDAILHRISQQQKRIAPTGYRRHDRHAAWVRVTDVRRQAFRGPVYSLEVPDSGTFVTTGGLVVHNCFPKDISFLKLLAGNSGYHFQLVTAVMEVNDLQMRRPVSKLQRHLGQLRGKRIALLGLAFKANTDDMREAPSIVLAARLLAEGAEVVAWDPVADAQAVLHGVTFVDSVTDALADADAAVVVTEWPELRELPWVELRETMRSPVVVDGRNHLDAAAMRAAGYVYEGMGRSASPFAALPETPEPASTLPRD